MSQLVTKLPRLFPLIAMKQQERVYTFMFAFKRRFLLS